MEESISADIDSMARPSGEQIHQVEELLEILAQTDVDGVGVMLNFITR